ncbi:uncharacterized protein LOC134789043 [Penaeus indicus]|uniref:uncharacterized protein LOC134789043 n=1 Tax=Penaeus indicus TaxID=29960 RepID=UPI00300D859B
MLDATNTMDEDVKVLEVVSDAEEVESEHEEGEISEDDDEDEEDEVVGLSGQQHFPHHYPSACTEIAVPSLSRGTTTLRSSSIRHVFSGRILASTDSLFGEKPPRSSLSLTKTNVAITHIRTEESALN